ncbi:MAG: hypothetical protein JHC95_15025, partial [Solirubrobacteraceae bacterium]|nr:hypothetical protein [Solirubrobacteraceae bacterium]
VGAVPDFAGDPIAATGTITDDDKPLSQPAATPAPMVSAPQAPASIPVAPKPVAKKPTLTSMASLPSTKECVSRRKFRIRLRSPKGGKIVRATVKLRGTTVATRVGKRVTAPIDLRGLPKGRFAVGIRITLADGQIVTGTRKYRTCAAKRSTGGAKPKV